MSDAAGVPWARLAVLAGGLLASAVVVRGVTALTHIAIGEARYRANDPDTWLKWIG